jgi:hypothetical protein
MYVLSIKRGTLNIILITFIQIFLDFWQRRDFSFLHNAQTGCGAHPASYSMGMGAISPGAKRPRRVAEHTLSFSVEVKVELYLHSPHMSS